MSGLPNGADLQGAIDSQVDAEAGIRSALAKEAFLVQQAKNLIGAAGVALTVAGVPYAGTAAGAAKILIDLASKEV